MIKFLHDWLTIIIAALSLIMSIITNKKNSKQNCEYREKMQEVEFEKEKIHQRERKIDEMFMQLNSRSNLIPYFHLILDDSKIEKIIHNGSRQIKLVIGLINIGKESATNIMLFPMGEGLENYLETLYEKENSYFIHDYLSQNFALFKENVTFSIVKEIPKDNDGKIANFIKFKIRFRDLIGNLYEQEFEFGYDNYVVNGFNLKSSSSVPYLIEE
ncbi:hypothetical protein [Ruminococcus sp.]|uniref:hypothetical protein n=1 Tax=Ruminococcus sp. TaxID=41978 RepID=UPI00033AC618|nr:uncharacterized protein BN537_01820 [Firmicutes bacterium CAG:212]SCH19674.1 Uncharacterised protein [uncultured Clostridium sp.]